MIYVYLVKNGNKWKQKMEILQQKEKGVEEIKTSLAVTI